MKRLITVILSFTLLTLFSTALAGMTSSVPAGPYHSAQYGYSLSFPAGWYSIAEDPATRFDVGEDFNNTQDLADGSSWAEFKVLKTGTALTDKAVIDAVRGEEDEDKFTVFKDAVTLRDGTQVRSLEGNTVADGDPMRYMAVALAAPARHTVLLLIIKSPPEVMLDAAMKKQIRSMLDSFRVTD